MTYGTVEEGLSSALEERSQRATSSMLNRKTLAYCAVAAIVLVTVVVLAATQQAGSVELKSNDSAVYMAEQSGIASTQKKLDALNRKEQAETAILKKHAINSKKEAILSKASKAKASASREIAAALLATVKQHTEELEKQKDIAEEKKEMKVFKTENAKAIKLNKKASIKHAIEKKESAIATKMTQKALKDKTELKKVQKEIDSDRLKIDSLKLIAQNKKADAATESHLADLGIESSKAREQTLEHIKHKGRRLARRIAQLQRSYKKDKSDEKEDEKAENEYRAETDAARKEKQALHNQIHELKIEQKDESRKADSLARTLQDQKDVVHEKDNIVERESSKQHEARTALRRAQDRLKDAERQIYQAQMKNEADRNPSDADLGLV